MNAFLGFLRLTRATNLVFIILTQVFLRYFLVVPVLTHIGIGSAMNHLQFGGLVLATVLIAAAGYIINDYFDVKIDSSNKPNRIVIDRLVSRRTAMALHLVFNIIAIVIGAYLAWEVDNLKLAVIFPLAAGLLWFYSTSYKKMFLVGNIVVSFLTATVVMVVWLYESTFYDEMMFDFVKFSQDKLEVFKRTLYTFLGYSFFAFLVSMVREIIKDMEDIHGDVSFHCRTMPIVIGLKKSKAVAAVLAVVMIAALVIVQFKFFTLAYYWKITYLFLLIQAPLMVILWQLQEADKRKDFQTLSTITKIIMLAGIISIPLFNFIK